MILLLFLYSSAIAQEPILEEVRGSNAILPCKLNGTFHLPEWSGPPDFTIYSKPAMHYIDNSVALSAIEHRLNRSMNDLVIRDVKKEDEGIYQCSYGFLTYRIRLVVIDTGCGSDVQVELLFVVRGSIAVFPCKLNGTEWKGPPNLTIYASQGQIFATTIGARSASEQRLYRSNNHLVIINVTKEDEGTYQCSHNNRSCRFSLNVTDPANDNSPISADTDPSKPIATVVIAVAVALSEWIIFCTVGICCCRTHQIVSLNGSLKKPKTWIIFVCCYLFIWWFFKLYIYLKGLRVDADHSRKDRDENCISEQPQNIKINGIEKNEKRRLLHPSGSENENNIASSEDESITSDIGLRDLLDGVISRNILGQITQQGSDTDSNKNISTDEDSDALDIEDSEVKMNLFKAVDRDDVVAIKEICALHPDKMKHMPALHHACTGGKLNSIAALLEMKADINAKDKSGNAPIHIAVINGMENVLDLLLKYNPKIDIQNKNRHTSLHIAVGMKNIFCIKKLLANGASVNIQDKQGDTIMHDAIRSLDFTIIDNILKPDNADFSIKNKMSFNVLHWAAFIGNTRAAKIIIRQKPELVNSQMKKLYTPLHICAANDRQEITSALLQVKADANIQDENSQTPLHLAIKKRNTEMTELLLGDAAVDVAAVDVDIQDKEGNTALHLISSNIFKSHKRGKLKGNQMKQFRKKIKDHMKSEADITCILIEHGASVELKNKDDLTPMGVCKDDVKADFLKRLAKSPSHKNQLVTRNGFTLPTHWEPARHGRIVLDRNSEMHSEEFEDVQQRFSLFLSKATIFKIERIQSTASYERYHLEKKLLKHLEKDVTQKEFILYISIDIQNVNEICDSSKSLLDILKGDEFKNLGKCIIFRSKMEYSDRLSTGDSHKLILQCKVLPGKLIREDLVKKKCKMGLGSTQCIVDSTDDPTLFRIFTKDQYYPEYVIEYK